MPGAVAQLAECLSGMRENPAFISALINRCGLPTSNASTQKVEAEDQKSKVIFSYICRGWGGAAVIVEIMFFYPLSVSYVYIIICVNRIYLLLPPCASSTTLQPNLSPRIMFFLVYILSLKPAWTI